LVQGRRIGGTQTSTMLRGALRRVPAKKIKGLGTKQIPTKRIIADARFPGFPKGRESTE